MPRSDSGGGGASGASGGRYFTRKHILYLVLAPLVSLSSHPADEAEALLRVGVGGGGDGQGLLHQALRDLCGL